MAEDHEDDGDDDGGQNEQDDGSSHGFSFLTCGNIGVSAPAAAVTAPGLAEPE